MQSTGFPTISDFLFSDLCSPNGFQTLSDNTVKYPASDIKYTETDVYICVAVTGIKKEHLSVEIDGNLVKVNHIRPDNREVDPFVYFKRQICKKEFYIAYKVDNKYNLDKSEVVMENGELIIKIPLKEENIPVKKKLSIG